MSGRALIVVVTGVIITTSVILYNIGASSTRIVHNLNQYYRRQSAQNIAQSGVNLSIRQLGNNLTWRANGPLWSVDMLGGKAFIRVFDTSYGGISPAVCIRSMGIVDYNTQFADTETSTAYAWVPPIVVPTFTKALLNLNGPNKVAGNITIDGRDFDPFSTTVNTGQGTYGVWTTASSFTPSGSGAIGGTTAAGLDVTPYNVDPKANPPDTLVIALNRTYPGGAPTSPDSVFGYNEGVLKALAKSGFAGSQYVTDPATLKSPLSGVTYVDLPNSSPSNSWQAGNLTGSGILVVHNGAHNATIKNANGKYPSTGGFSGILIADDAQNINVDFWGAILVLTPDPQGNILGTGNAILRYSKQAMKNAVGVLKNGSQLKILAWYE